MSGTPIQWDAGSKVLSLTGMEDTKKEDAIGALVAKRIHELSGGSSQPSLYLGNGPIVARVAAQITKMAGEKKAKLMQTILTVNAHAMHNLQNGAERVTIPETTFDMNTLESRDLIDLPWHSTLSVVQADDYLIQNGGITFLSHHASGRHNMTHIMKHTTDSLICCMTLKEQRGSPGGFHVLADDNINGPNIRKYLVTDAPVTDPQALYDLKRRRGWNLVTEDADWEHADTADHSSNSRTTQ